MNPEIAPEHAWFKSSYSGGSGTECVECARTSNSALVRDSKDSGGPVVTVGRNAWQALIRAVGQGVLKESHSRASLPCPHDSRSRVRRR